MADKIANSGATNYYLTSSKTATYGYTLQFKNTSYYLYTNGSTLSANQNSIAWNYKYNEIYINKSRVYTVSSANVQNKYLSIDGSKVSTDGTATYLYTVNYANSTYSLGNIATGVTNGNRYAIVICQKSQYLNQK